MDQSNLEGYFGLDGITFADFSGTGNFREELILQNFPRLLILERITFQDFPSREILRRIIITTSADSIFSPTQKIFPGCDIHLFARIFTPDRMIKTSPNLVRKLL